MQILIRIGKPWMPILVWIWQNDADPTGSDPQHCTQPFQIRRLASFDQAPSIIWEIRK
jgi:hypothetical protein